MDRTDELMGKIETLKGEQLLEIISWMMSLMAMEEQELVLGQIDGVVANLNGEGDEQYEFDDSMDGDHASALASAGFGTDEDYGFFGGEDY